MEVHYQIPLKHILWKFWISLQKRRLVKMLELQLNQLLRVEAKHVSWAWWNLAHFTRYLLMYFKGMLENSQAFLKVKNCVMQLTCFKRMKVHTLVASRVSNTCWTWLASSCFVYIEFLKSMKNQGAKVPIFFPQFQDLEPLVTTHLAILRINADERAFMENTVDQIAFVKGCSFKNPFIPISPNGSKKKKE